MIWEDERYVRVYTRDTPEWLALSFDAQALFLLLLRKVNRAGLIPLGKVGRKAVAHITGHGGDWERLSPALDELLVDGCAKIVGDVLSIPNFVAAQEAITTGAQRTRDWRERRGAQELLKAVSRDVSSRDVTPPPPPSDATSRDGDETSRFVTRPPTVVTPYCTVPSVPSVPSVPNPDAVASLPCPAASCEKAAASPLEGLDDPDQLALLARPAKAEGEEGAPTTPPRPKLKKTTPQGEAFDFWRAEIWPRLSSAPCPKPTSAEMVQLDRRCKELGLAEVTAAMQRAEQSPYWHEKLDLLTFCQKIPRFLPRTTGPPDGKGALPVSEPSEEDVGYTGRRNFLSGEYLDADDPENAEWKARREARRTTQ